MRIFPKDWSFVDKLMSICFVIFVICSVVSLSVGCTNFKMSAEKAEVEVSRG